MNWAGAFQTAQVLGLALIAFFGIAGSAQGADSYVVAAGAQEAIVEHGECRFVNNGAAQAIFIPTRSAAEWSSFYNNAPPNVTVTNCASCNLDGVDVAHGGSATFYMSVRPCNGSCGAISQVRTCFNGTLDGDAAYSKGTCPAESCASCTTQGINWSVAGVNCSASAPGGTHNTVRNLSDASAPGLGSASVQCANGTWNEQAGSTCTTASCSLPWGGTISSGQTTAAYLNSSEPCGSSCQSQSRTCNDGTLSGSYTNQSCSVSGCASCTTPWGTTVPHGDGALDWNTVTAFQSASVPFGESCVSENRSCNNGTLSGSYVHQSCSVGGAANCTAPWGTTVAHGSSVNAYQASSVSCGNSCVSELRSCNNGTLSGSYASQSCSVGGCGCPLPWGGSISVGENVRAYRAQYASGSCNDLDELRFCNNSAGGPVLTGSYTFQSCQPGSQACGVPSFQYFPTWEQPTPACDAGTFVAQTNTVAEHRWGCALNSGVDAFTQNCTARTQAECRAYNAGPYNSQPATDLASGCWGGQTYVDVADQNNQWRWECRQANGLNTQVCSASRPIGGCSEELVSWQDSVLPTTICSTNVGPSANGATVTAISGGGTTGTATYRCISGSWFRDSGATCSLGGGCAPGTVTWTDELDPFSPICMGNIGSGPQGTLTQVTSFNGTPGSAPYLCGFGNNWSLQPGASCGSGGGFVTCFNGPSQVICSCSGAEGGCCATACP